MPQKYTRKLERLTRAEKAEKSYYVAFGDIYAAFERFLNAAHTICWSNEPCADLAIHLNNGSGMRMERVTAIQNFLRDGDKVVHALGINLRACTDPFGRHKISPHRIAIDILRETRDCSARPMISRRWVVMPSNGS